MLRKETVILLFLLQMAALPTAFQPWVCLVIAHQRCGDLVSAEIAARMMVQDYPSSATAKDCLARVLQMGVM